MINNEFFHRCNVEALARALSIDEAKEERHQSMSLHMASMMSTYTRDCRDRNITGLKSPKMILKCKRLVFAMPKTSRCRGIVICSRSRRLHEAYLNFLLHMILPSNHNEAMKIKIKSQNPLSVRAMHSEED